ncbi:MAG: DUF354 domain-containing protein [Pyrobaculum sp.]
MTKLLSDALTPKQARIAAVLYKEGRRRGIELIITCREYFHLSDVLKMYDVPYVCIGKYGASLYEKLIYGIERQRALAEVAKDVDGYVGFPSPDATRVVFGLGKPLVVLNDTPHATHVNRLVLPLAEVLVAPVAVPVEVWKPYCPRRVVTFEGVFEYMWVSRFKPNPSVVKSVGLEPGGYVVLRPEESYAAYYKWNTAQVRRAFVELIRSMGYVVVNIPRYADQIIDGAVNLTKAIDHLQLAYFSAGVVTGGATMATEAALLGVPSLSYFPETYYIDEYLQKNGAPLYRCKGLEQCVETLRLMLKTGKTTPLKLEDPTEVVTKAVADVVAR